MNGPPVLTSVLHDTVIRLLQERGVQLDDIAEMVLALQTKYFPGLTREQCLESVRAVIAKREVQNALLTGIQLDMLAEQKRLLSPLQEMLERDESLYGIDEVMALAIVNLYGSIGFTNFGYVDKVKLGVLQWLNNKDNGVHTFLDDLIGAVAAAASSRLAHRCNREREERLAMQLEFNQTVK